VRAIARAFAFVRLCLDVIHVPQLALQAPPCGPPTIRTCYHRVLRASAALPRWANTLTRACAPSARVRLSRVGQRDRHRRWRPGHHGASRQPPRRGEGSPSTRRGPPSTLSARGARFTHCYRKHTSFSMLLAVLPRTAAHAHQVSPTVLLGRSEPPEMIA
jgi:hypothetical protein